MDKFNLVGITAIIFVAGAFIIINQTDIAEALFAVPPTVAWDQIHIVNNVTIPISDGYLINATSYSDKLYILTDDSINISITQFP